MREKTITLSSDETDDLLQRLLRQYYAQRPVTDLSANEKCRLAVILNDKYRVDPAMIAQKLHIPVRIVNQTIRSKDFGGHKKQP